MLKSGIRKLFHLSDEVAISFYVIDFIFRRILRQNSKTTWPVHHTSVIHNPQNIIRGKESFPGESPNIYINAHNGIEIGDFTRIGPGVSLVSANHDFVDLRTHVSGGPIKIGSFCWIAAQVVILPEVVLGDYTIVGAGSVVTKSFEEGYCIIGGSPARLIRHLDKETCIAFAQSRK